MDQTIFDIHTGGDWKQSEELLAEHVRPEFVCLVQKLLEHEISVGIATFSSQVKLIESVLRLKLGENKVPVVGWFNTPIPNFEKGKQGQLYTMLQHFGKDTNSQSDRKQTILVDDDLKNIRVAKRDGYRVVPYYPDKSTDPNVLVLKRHAGS